MTKNLLITPVALLILAILACTGKNDRRSASEIWNKDELVVVMDMDTPGYFTFGEEQYGYHFDILRDYAGRIGATLRVVTGKTRSECLRMLEEGEADIAASPTFGTSGKYPAIPIYSTSYVMLAREGGSPRRARGETRSNALSALPDLPDLRDKRILIPSGFKSTRGYGMMIDSLCTAQAFVCEQSAPEMMESLSGGAYDYLICEKSEALLNSSLYPGLRTVYDFAEEVRISVQLGRHAKGFREDFTAWLGEYRSGHEYATLAELYLERTSLTAISAFRRTEKPQTISQYDDIIRMVAEREGLDWRFLSAIAYHESRFKSHVVSHMGARGIMQVMPVVARNFNIPVENIGDTETNVTLAAKLIKAIEGSIGFPTSVSGRDRMSIVLACYNAGTGHITDARRLARKYGYNADSWENVSYFLKLKSQPEYYNDEVVRNGAFRSGAKTSLFVENVMEQYNNYRILARK